MKESFNKAKEEYLKTKSPKVLYDYIDSLIKCDISNPIVEAEKALFVAAVVFALSEDAKDIKDKSFESICRFLGEAAIYNYYKNLIMDHPSRKIYDQIDRKTRNQAMSLLRCHLYRAAACNWKKPKD